MSDLKLYHRFPIDEFFVDIHYNGVDYRWRVINPFAQPEFRILAESWADTPGLAAGNARDSLKNMAPLV
tara:strand:+ start:1884 stop:2090 length:207 start_codon:yes stop_codon:yes gene_type:complete